MNADWSQRSNPRKDLEEAMVGAAQKTGFLRAPKTVRITRAIIECIRRGAKPPVGIIWIGPPKLVEELKSLLGGVWYDSGPSPQSND